MPETLFYDKMHDKKNSFEGSNPTKCIVLSSGLPMHSKMNLEIYQTQKVMNLIVTLENLDFRSPSIINNDIIELCTFLSIIYLYNF